MLKPMNYQIDKFHVHIEHFLSILEHLFTETYQVLNLPL